VARDRDEERTGGGEQVVQARVKERGVDGEVDAVADRADDTELRELHPVRPRTQSGVCTAAARDVHRRPRVVQARGGPGARRPGAIGAREARTQGAALVVLGPRLRTRPRAAERGRTAQSLARLELKPLWPAWE